MEPGGWAEPGGCTYLAGDVIAGNGGVAEGWLVEAGEHGDERSLAGSVGTQQSEALPSLDGQRHAVYRDVGGTASVLLAKLVHHHRCVAMETITDRLLCVCVCVWEIHVEVSVLAPLARF